MEEIAFITNWPLPKKTTEIHCFLGVTSSNGKFVERFASMGKPIAWLTYQDVKFKWTESVRVSSKIGKDI